MKRWSPRIAPRDPRGWLLAILLVGCAVSGIGECVDWLDRRACRVDGGHVQKLDSNREWRCAGRGGNPMTRDTGATATFAVRFPSGELVRDPANWMLTTYSLSEAYLWLWPIDEADDARAARLVEVKRQLRYPSSGAVVAVRAKP